MVLCCLVTNNNEKSQIHKDKPNFHYNKNKEEEEQIDNFKKVVENKNNRDGQREREREFNELCYTSWKKTHRFCEL